MVSRSVRTQREETSFFGLWLHTPQLYSPNHSNKLHLHLIHLLGCLEPPQGLTHSFTGSVSSACLSCFLCFVSPCVAQILLVNHKLSRLKPVNPNPPMLYCDWYTGVGATSWTPANTNTQSDKWRCTETSQPESLWSARLVHTGCVCVCVCGVPVFTGYERDQTSVSCKNPSLTLSRGSTVALNWKMNNLVLCSYIIQAACESVHVWQCWHIVPARSSGLLPVVCSPTGPVTHDTAAIISVCSVFGSKC